MNTRNQRTSQRYPCIVPVRFKTDTLKHAAAAHMVNFSEGGLCLDCDIFVTIGTEVHVRIENNPTNLPDFQPFNLYPTRVCWHSRSEKDPAGHYNLGLRYID